MRHLTYLLPFLIFILSGCSNTTTLRHRADYDSTLMRHKEVLVLPPQAEINMVDASRRKDRMYNYEYYFEDIIESTIVTAVQEKGFRTKLLRKKDIRDQGLYDDYTRLRQSYNLVREELYAPLLWEESKAFNITQKVNMEAAKAIGEKTSSDIIVMIDYAGAVKTNGARACDFVVSILFSPAAAEGADKSVIIIGLIEAKTGNVLWANMISDSKDLYRCAFANLSSEKKVEQERLDRLINLLLRPLVKG